MTIGRTRFLALAALAVTASVAACSTAPAQPPTSATARAATPAAATSPTARASLPDSPVGAQARWLLSVATHPPIPAAAITAHFDQAFLRQVTPARLNGVFARVSTLRLDAITLSTTTDLIMTVTADGQTQLKVSMGVDSSGLISGLLLQPAGPSATPPPVPTTWAGVEAQVRSVAPQARMLVAAVSGSACQPIQSIDAATPAPLGSAFKLYVLDALASAVASGRVSWNQQLTITSQLKSLPSGHLQDEPDGTRVSVRQVADDMISQSDNTAATMLTALVGRTAVEQAAAASGIADPGLDVPFLTTKEMFVLKLIDWPRLASSYLARSAAGRMAMLTTTIDRVPYSALTATNLAAWTAPRDIDSIEWFASPTDVCHLYASLAGLARQPGLGPVAAALQINNGGIGLDPGQWRAVWFKGGSEPGVLTLNYLATTRDGRSYVVSVLAENPDAPIAQTPASLTLLSAIKGAFELAAR